MVNTAGLEEIRWLLLRADSSVDVEASGLESIVTERPVRGLVMSLMYAEVPLIVELVISEVWLFIVFGNSLPVTVTAGLLIV